MSFETCEVSYVNNFTYYLYYQVIYFSEFETFLFFRDYVFLQ